MSMLIASTGRDLSRWIEALQKEGPDIEILLPEQVHDKSAIRFALSWYHPHGMFTDYPNLGCISSFGAGVDHIVSDPGIPEQVAVVRIIDPLLCSDMASFTLAVLLSQMRRLPYFWKLKQGKTWKKRSYKRMAETRVGIMGTGVIGHHVATTLHGMGFKVSGWARNPGKPTPYVKYHGKGQMAEFLGNLDYLVCLLPLTAETTGIINQQLLQKLPRGAFLINLGRGAHVVDADLLHMIDKGQLSGAHLDVFEPEPLPTGHPFWAHPAIQISPHVASLTDPGSVAPQVIGNYRRLLEGRELLHTVCRQLGY